MAEVSMIVGPEAVGRILLLCWKATRLAQKMGLPHKIPVCIVGDTGCGKTEAVKQFHAKLAEQFGSAKKPIDLKLWTMILSMVPPEDIGGYPSVDPDTGKIKSRMLEYLPFDCNDYGIMFMDEYDRATPETQNASLQVTLGGQYHGHALSENVYPVMAMNGTADIYTNPLSQAARTRVCTVFMGMSADPKASSYVKWSKKNGLPEVCRVFNTDFSSHIKCVEKFEEMAVCTRRTLDMAGLVTLAKQQVDLSDKPFETDDIYPAIIAGLIGMEGMTRYLSIERAIKEQLDVTDIIEDPENAPLLEDPSMIFYAVQGIIGKLEKEYESDIKKVRAVAEYALRFPHDEWIEIWMNALSIQFPKLVESNVYNRWTNRKQRKGKGMM